MLGAVCAVSDCRPRELPELFGLKDLDRLRLPLPTGL
jgi:hypothetical protein